MASILFVLFRFKLLVVSLEVSSNDRKISPILLN